MPGAVRTIAAFFDRDRPAPSLPLYLLFGLLVRLPAILFAHGFEFVDQQFQYIDPAWHPASGDDWLMTHEWINGLRSWVYPGMLAPVLRAFAWIEDPLVRMAAVRGVHAVVSLLPLAAFWMLVVQWRPLPRPRSALLFFALSGLLVYAGTQPSGPTFAAGLATAAVLLFLGPAPWAPLGAGLCLGLAFCCRFQDALFGPVLFAAGLLTRRWKQSLWLALGCVPPLLLQALVDLKTWGALFHSPLAFLRFNVIEGRSAQWATRPFWYYFALGVVPYLLLVPPFLRANLDCLRRAASRLAIPLAAAAFYLLVLSLIPRKSMRFTLPAFTILSAVLAVGLFELPLREGLAAWHKRLVTTFQIGILILLSFHQFNRGPIQAAIALGEDPGFTGELTVVDGQKTDVGGYYYLHRKKVNLELVRREDLAGRAARLAPFLMVVRLPLEPALVEELGAEFLGAFSNCPDHSRGRRRFLYRLPRIP